MNIFSKHENRNDKITKLDMLQLYYVVYKLFDHNLLSGVKTVLDIRFCKPYYYWHIEIEAESTYEYFEHCKVYQTREQKTFGRTLSFEEIYNENSKDIHDFIDSHVRIWNKYDDTTLSTIYRVIGLLYYSEKYLVDQAFFKDNDYIPLKGIKLENLGRAEMHKFLQLNHLSIICPLSFKEDYFLNNLFFTKNVDPYDLLTKVEEKYYKLNTKNIKVSEKFP